MERRERGGKESDDAAIAKAKGQPEGLLTDIETSGAHAERKPWRCQLGLSVEEEQSPRVQSKPAIFPPSQTTFACGGRSAP
mmetsp:Transcript_6073/g.12672  ORF Transcript_6073/g.12672 Transcript_6073/m.12672 type:complete len:81 (-) Transcript_6073:228-470(-)